MQNLTGIALDAVFDWAFEQPSLKGSNVLAGALNNTGRKLQRCAGPLLRCMIAPSLSAGLMGEITIPPALKLKETTCLVLSPAVASVVVGRTDSSFT